MLKKGYVTKDNKIDFHLKALDDEFKSWFPEYTVLQFIQIEVILYNSILAKFTAQSCFILHDSCEGFDKNGDDISFDKFEAFVKKYMENQYCPNVSKKFLITH